MRGVFFASAARFARRSSREVWADLIGSNSKKLFRELALDIFDPELVLPPDRNAQGAVALSLSCLADFFG